MILATAFTIEGREIAETIGLVRGPLGYVPVLIATS